MGQRLAQSLALALASAVGGCGGLNAEPSPPIGSADLPGTGGHAVGGVMATGGAVSSGGAVAMATGGFSSSGGNTALGGSTTIESSVGGRVFAAGRASAIGGTQTVGGSRDTGGAIASAGAPTGGRIATGGSPTTGGVKAVGGTNASAGTTPTGGVSATGGAPASAGSSAAGGAVATGGAISSGGAQPIWPKKFCGNTTTGNTIDPLGLSFAEHWDQITPEYAGKWGAVQANPTSGAFNWTSLDAIYAYAEQNAIIFKEHTFVWGASQPTGQTPATLETWIKAFCERYPRTALIDVVNEPPPHTIPKYANELGQGETGAYPWITKAFKLARKYCGNAVLLLNDYDNLEVDSQEEHFIDIVKDIRAAGAPIDAVGAQAHDAYKLTASHLQANLVKLATETGLPIYITEYDVNLSDDEAQRAAFASQFPLFWSSSYVRGVTVWGWIMGRTWRSNTGLVKDNTPRPAMTWLMEYLDRPKLP